MEACPMRYLEHREHRKHGTFDFPFALYGVGPHHPRYNMILHWHAEYEIIRILTGELLVTLDDRQFVAAMGDTLFITDGILHAGAPRDCYYECIVFDMNALLEENHTCSRDILSIIRHEKMVQCLFPPGELFIQPFVRQMFEAMSAREHGYQFLVQGALYSFLGTVIRNELYETGAAVSDKSIRRLGRFKSVLSLIRYHYQDDLSLTDLAGCLNMNSKYFCRFFKEMTQMTPIEYLNYYRIECACEQMMISDKNITEIALSCGFNDVSYFTKVFKKHKGLTPSQYLRQVYAT